MRGSSTVCNGTEVKVEDVEELLLVWPPAGSAIKFPFARVIPFRREVREALAAKQRLARKDCTRAHNLLEPALAVTREDKTDDIPF